jgi:ornithine carbamoyltransferase
MNRFLDLADFSREEVKDLLGLAVRLQRHPDPHALAGKVLGLLFMNPSLRTLASFQSGMMRLGGSVYVVTPGQGTWQMETRSGAVMNGAAAEHVKESVPVLASYCDAIGIRMFAEHKNLAADLAETQFKMMTDLCDKPLVNMESAMNHPCQALADWHTMDELKVPERGKFVLSWYAKEWGSPQHYGDNEAEARVREYLGDWCVKDSWFKSTDPDCHFMHCLPVRRNVAVDDEVLDGSRSVVIREAYNRMVVQMAVLHRLLRS